MYVSSSGGESNVITSDLTNAILGYDATTRRLFVLPGSSISLYSMKLDGSDRQEMFKLETFKRYTVDDINNKIYYLSSNTGTTQSVLFDGSDPETLLAGGNEDLTDIQIDSMKQ